MKKIYSLSFAFGFAGSLFAQLPVSTAPSNKKVVLEEFTGITCVFCPDGHKRANDLAAANPGSFFPVNIHTGGFATPTGPGTDFRTTDGNTIANQPTMGITGYPQGAVNRRLWGTSAAMAHSRADWAANSAVVLAEPSYVNVAGQATLNVVTRVMTIDLEAYYTANSPSPTNKYTVMLLQDNISGPQTGAAANPTYINADGTYRHMHMLRDVLNPTVLGDDITTTTMGTTFTNQLTYTVPTNFTGVEVALADLSILVFISESNTNIITAAKVPISYVGFTTALNASVTNLVQLPETCKNSVAPSFRLTNQGSTTLTAATINYNVNGGTPQVFNWTGTLTPLASTNVQLPAVTFTLAATNNLTVAVSAVNGGVDEDLSNNAGTNSFTETTSAANTVNMVLSLTQDRYGSETTWNVKNETGAIVAQGGPYADLAANGVLLHNEAILVPASGCYSVEILDSFGDGLNSGYGVGGAVLRDGQGTTVWTSNGQFTSQAYREFKVTTNINSLGVEDLTAEGFAIYPNPATEKVTVAFEAQNGAYEISILDLTGRVMATQNVSNVNGSQNVEMSVDHLSAGNYLISISKDGLKFTKQISVQ